MIKSRDVTTLSLKTMETYANFGQRYVKEFVDLGVAKRWIVGRQLIDLVQQFPLALDAGKLRALTRPLTRAPTRLRQRAAKSARRRIC